MPLPTARPEALTQTQQVEAVRALARLNSRAWGVAFALVSGLGLLLATWALVVRGGPTVGPHLGLLAVFFPGYSVTWTGGLVGFVYAFVIGYLVGRLVSSLYNLQARGPRP